MKVRIFFVLMLLLPVTVFSRIIRVPADFSIIQDAVEASFSGDTVLVAPGLYLETVSIEDKNILLTSSDGPEETEIRGFVIFRHGVDTTCVLRGFTVIPDPSDPWYDARSLISIEYGSPIIEGNIVKGANAVVTAGGGISELNSNTIIRDNIIRDNRALYGGGLALGGGTPIVERNVIANNSAPYFHTPSGGGISMSSGIVRYNLIINNQVTGNMYVAAGGGIGTYFPITTLRHIYNNTIVGNSARIRSFHGEGGGIYILARSDQNENVFYKNNIIAFNSYGGGVYVNLRDSVQVNWNYNLVFGNDSADYSGLEPAEHDIQVDPLNIERFSGDHHLLAESLCKDAGDPGFSLDPDSTRADIGAYYFDQTIGIDDAGEPTGPYGFQLKKEYTSPFRARILISYDLSDSAFVSLIVFSITGQLAKVIVDKEVQSAGEHRYSWEGNGKDGLSASTGIYFYELYVDDYRESKVMIVLR